MSLRYPTFRITDATRCDACGAVITGTGWQPKAAHVAWHVEQLLVIGRRVRGEA